MLMFPIRNLRFFLLPVFAVALAPALFHAQDAAPPRPQITGVSHVGYFVSDLPKTHRVLARPAGLRRIHHAEEAGDGSDPHRVHQDQRPPAHRAIYRCAASPPSMMSHYCFSVSNVEQMRAYLRSKGLDVKPGNGGKPHRRLRLRDQRSRRHAGGVCPEPAHGHRDAGAGKFMPPTRIADAIYHVGFLVGNLDKSLAFYEGILGFTETWRGSSTAAIELGESARS